MSVRERGLYWVRHKNSPKSWLIGRYHPEKGWSQYDNGATMFEENMVEIGQRIVSPTEIPSLDAPPLNLSPSQVNWLIMALDYQRRSRIKESTINDEKLIEVLKPYSSLRKDFWDDYYSWRLKEAK